MTLSNAGFLLMLATTINCCGNSGEVDACKDIVCREPPENQCKDANTLLVYLPEGMCIPATKTCNYVAKERACAAGCANGRCAGETSLSGWIMVLELNDGNVNPGWGSGVRAYFVEQPHFVWFPEHRLDLQCQEVLSQGNCTLFAYCQDFDRMCDPVCGIDEQCVVEGSSGICRKFSVPRNVGTLAIEGLKVPMNLTADEFGRYFTFDAPDELFDRGDTVTIRTSGGEAGPFSIQATGVAPLEVESSDVVLTSGQQVEISWNPGDPQARVQIILTAGWHYPYAPSAAILCDVPDDEGQVDIPAVLVDDFLDRGSLFNRPSHALRYTRTVLPMPDGEVELTVGSVANLRLVPL